MKTQEKRFLVYNLTDGVVACPELLTLAEARGFVRSFPCRFARQGYYLTATWERIRPEAVLLEIVDTGDCPDLGGESVSESPHRGGQNE